MGPQGNAGTRGRGQALKEKLEKDHKAMSVGKEGRSQFSDLEVIRKVNWLEVTSIEKTGGAELTKWPVKHSCKRKAGKFRNPVSKGPWDISHKGPGAGKKVGHQEPQQNDREKKTGRTGSS